MYQKKSVKLKANLLVDESGDDSKLWQLLLPGLWPHIVCWYVSSPVNPVPWPSFGSIFQKVLHCPKRQVTLSISSPMPSLPPAQVWRAWIVTTTQRFLAVCSTADVIFLSGGTKSNIFLRHELNQNKSGDQSHNTLCWVKPKIYRRCKSLTLTLFLTNVWP